MTKKDFQLIVSVLAKTAPRRSDDDEFFSPVRGMWAVVVAGLADVLSAANPRFDREKFYDACGFTR